MSRPRLKTWARHVSEKMNTQHVPQHGLRTRPRTFISDMFQCMCPEHLPQHGLSTHADHMGVQFRSGLAQHWCALLREKDHIGISTFWLHPRGPYAHRSLIWLKPYCLLRELTLLPRYGKTDVDKRGKPSPLIYPSRAQTTTEIPDARQGKKIVAAEQFL